MHVVPSSEIDLTIRIHISCGKEEIAAAESMAGASIKVHFGSLRLHYILWGGVTIDRRRSTVTGLALHTRGECSVGILGLPGRCCRFVSEAGSVRRQERQSKIGKFC